VRHFDLDAHVEYNTRVEHAVKVTTEDGDKWRLTLHKLEPEPAAEPEAKQQSTSVRETFWVQDFDALVVATGHYNAPFIPSLDGATEWADSWPESVLHSNGYRSPEAYADRDVLIVGIGTSGLDIARDLTAAARRVYLVGKETGGVYAHGPDGYRTFRRMQRHLVQTTGAEGVGPIKRFRPPPAGRPIEEGEVELEDGRVITGLSAVLFATGYQYSVPFLPQFHRDPVSSTLRDASSKDADHDRLLVTDGGGILNLYRDVFYVPDPTLAFLGLSVNTSAFSFFEYQSLSVARVWGGTARLPSEALRREAYAELVRERGSEGKFTHFMGKENERKYVREAVAWLNADAKWSGAPPVEGHTEAWLAASDRTQANILTKYGIDGAKILALVKAELEAEKAEDARSAAAESANAAEVAVEEKPEETSRPSKPPADTNTDSEPEVVIPSARPLPPHPVLVTA
jgi:hypothetical protein